MNFPPADFCRCMNKGCPKRLSCLRANYTNANLETPYSEFPSWPECDQYVSDGSEIEEEQP